MIKNPEVSQWFKTSDNPKVDEMEAVRNIILNAHKSITEDIKWKAPNFIYNGNMCTFNPRAKGYVNLTFHNGAELNDPLGLLEGTGEKVRIAKFKDFAEIKQKKRALEMVIKEYMKSKVVHHF